MHLRIGKDGFSLPLELVTSTQAILARKRSGKSYTASVQAEELLRHKQQIASHRSDRRMLGIAVVRRRRWTGVPGGRLRRGPRRRSARTACGPDAGDGSRRARLLGHLRCRTDADGRSDPVTSDFASELLRINRTALHLYIHHRSPPGTEEIPFELDDLASSSLSCKDASRSAAPPLLLKLWREQHPEGHEQRCLNFSEKRTSADVRYSLTFLGSSKTLRKQHLS